MTGSAFGLGDVWIAKADNRVRDDAAEGAAIAGGAGGGALAGKQVGQHLGPRKVGLSYHDVRGFQKEKARLIADRIDLHAPDAGATYARKVKEGIRDVPGARHAIRGGRIGGAAGTVVGSVLGGVGAELIRNRRSRTAKSASGVGGEEMAMSAFGVEDDRISKADKHHGTLQASPGRLATGALLGPYHGLVAGRKGRKLRAAGNELGGSMIGSVAGGALAGALSRGKASSAGALIGNYGGGAAGTERAQRMGHYKPERRR